MIYKNTNKVLGNGFVGIKTGTTPGAGKCISLNYVDPKKEIDVVIVLLNSEDNKGRWADSKSLRDFVLKKFENGFNPSLELAISR